MDDIVTVRELLTDLYKDAEQKDLLDAPVGTISTGMSDDGGNIAGIVIFRTKQQKERRVEAYYRRCERK